MQAQRHDYCEAVKVRMPGTMIVEEMKGVGLCWDHQCPLRRLRRFDLFPHHRHPLDLVVSRDRELRLAKPTKKPGTNGQYIKKNRR